MRNSLKALLLGGWVIMSPLETEKLSTWACDCRIVYNEHQSNRVVETIFDTQEECERFRSEVARREQTRKERRIAYAKERECSENLVMRIVNRLFFSPSTSALCEAKRERWSRARCVQIEPPASGISGEK